jgi:HAE1 family hydrophobic/amphiphilic exporter-1
MVTFQNRAAAIAMKDPNVAGVMSAVGGGGSRSGNNTGTLLLKLKPLSERSLSADQVINEIRPKLSKIPGLRVVMQNPPAIRIGGNSSRAQYQYTLQDLDQTELQTAAQKLNDALATAPGFQDVTTDMDLNSPSVNVKIDRDKAASLGVSPSAIETALGSAFGGQQISTIYGSSNQYWVMLELLPQYQNDMADLNRLYITPGGAEPSSITPSSSSTPGGAGMIPLVPLSAVTTLVPSVMPLSVNHLGQLPAVTISFNLSPGYALSDATSTIAKVQQKLNLPPGIQGSFQGTAQAFQSSLSNIGVLLAIAILTVYIILGILYESFIHPLTILSGLPSAAVGALLTLMLFGVPLSLYGFVGMIMLIGIVKKNAIMMIDFALHREREEGVAPEVAIVEAALIRFRPIMMTTMAALMGTLPIAIGFGAGSEARRPLGLAVVGGLLLSQLLTLYITPVIYVYLDRLGSRLFGGAGHAPAHAPAE